MATATGKIKEVENSIENLAGETGRRAEGWTTQVQDEATQFVDKAKDFATDAGKKVQDLATTAAEKSLDAVKEYPLQSLLVGFGVGCLVGMLIPRR